MVSIRRTHAVWDNYYSESQHTQTYPDESLVRLLMPMPRGAALDLGCGRGRHLALLNDLNFAPIYASDISAKALEKSCQDFPFVHGLRLPTELWSSAAFQFALPEHSLQVIVAWGVLHYNPQSVIEHILNEVRRLLAPDGFFVGTLRANTDTHLKARSDVSNGDWHFYDEEQSRALLANNFSTAELGYLERRPVGVLEQRIAHWIFAARP